MKYSKGLSGSLVYLALFLFFQPAVFSEYRVGVGDVLHITIIGKQDYRFQEDVTVSDKGSIFISLMNSEVPVQGLTIPEIDKKLTDILAADYLVDPEVLVDVKEYKSHKILVIGDLKRPGEMILDQERISLKSMLMRCGGPTGDMEKRVVVIRAGKEKGQDVEIFTLEEVLMENPKTKIEVEPSDIVYVLGKDKNLPVQNLDNVVYVFGEVKNPGLMPYTRNLTTLRAILNAGNFTKEAAPGRVSIKRKENGKIRTINVDLKKVMSGGDKSADVSLKPGDVIYIPRAIF